MTDRFERLGLMYKCPKLAAVLQAGAVVQTAKLALIR